jgi:hypothetical protein
MNRPKGNLRPLGRRGGQEVARYIDVLSEKYNVKKDEIMKNIVRNIRYVEKYLDEYMKKQYYILIRRRYSSREIISIVGEHA